MRYVTDPALSPEFNFEFSQRAGERGRFTFKFYGTEIVAAEMWDDDPALHEWLGRSGMRVDSSPAGRPS